MKPEQPALPLFPTREGATWEDVSIRFRDGQTVSVAVRDVRSVLSYVQLGMANRSNTRPTLQWELLRALAEKRGALDWGPGATRRNQKRRERLARDLARFFRIEGDPIVSFGTGWRCRFSLEPEAA